MSVPAGPLSPPAEALVRGVDTLRLERLLYVPCSTAAAVIAHYGSSPTVKTTVVTKEEEGVGVLSGLILAGRRAALLIQDTGFGNAITALTTFGVAYHVPLFIIATRTGGAREINSAVHEYSDRLPATLSAAGIYHSTLDIRVPLDRWPAEVHQHARYAETSHKPVALFVDLKWR
jgi:sulfopyruvate decarboxylase subunit alpha